MLFGKTARTVGNLNSYCLEFARNSNSLDLENRLQKSIYSASYLPIEIRRNIFSDIEWLTASAEEGEMERELLEGFSRELKLPE